MAIKLKKRFYISIAAICGAAMLAGCGTSQQTEQNHEKLRVVATIFPEYDWVKEIAGDNADITMLLDKGVDLHSYQPTADDIMKISDCDVFIYVGGESEVWVDDALAEAVNRDMAVINLLDALGDKVKMEEGVSEEETEEEEYDEHIWLSLKNAELLCEDIAEALAQADADNAELYRHNAAVYAEKLAALDVEYSDAVSAADKDTLVFGDRFPFRYLVDDYGLSYYAAFSGCSAETEASFETVAFLADKLDELNLGSIITIDGSDKKIAETIVQNSDDKNREILMLDSMQSTTLKDVEDGTTYYSIMKKNLETLKEALK